MRTESYDPHRVASILERLNHHLAAFTRLPRRRLEDLAGAACGLVSDVLQYRTVLLRVGNGNGLACALKKDRQGGPLPVGERDARLLQFVSNTVQEPMVLDMGEVRSAMGVLDSALPAAGGPALAAPIRCGGAGKGYGHLVALRPYGAHDPDVDLPLLGILASFTGKAARNCEDLKRMAGIKTRLLSEVRISRKLCQTLRDSGEHWRIMAEHAHEWEAWLSPDGSVLHSSPSCARISGYMPENFRQDPSLLERIIHEDDLPVWRRAMEDGSMLHCPCAEYRIMHRDGFVRWVSQATVRIRSAGGRDRGLRLSIRDITEQKCAELQVRAEALRDPLTGLPGRVLCLDRVEQALERAGRRDNYFFALVSVGMDCFDFFAQCCDGQEERLHAGIGERLRRCVRRMDTVTSLESGEFVVLLDDLAAPREAIRVCKRIRTALAKPFLMDGCEMNLRASLGVTIGSSSADRAQTLLRNARLAMRQAEKAGRYRFKAFTPRLYERLGQRRALVKELRRAVTRCEFRLAFQPIVSLRESKLAGVEALVRWLHPERGTLGPEEFLPLAEETGLIVDIGAWVLEEACRTTAAWLADLDRSAPLTVSVNVSGRQLARPDMVDHVRTVLEKTGLPPERLRLDITEAALLFDAATAMLTLSRLRAMGVRISLDDFRAGAPSLGNLQVFPLDDLKIDLNGLGRISCSPEAMENFRDVVHQARGLGLDVVAEGVEESMQEEALSALGVEFGQGFLYSRPMSAEQAGARIPLLAREPARTEWESAPLPL
ncbi:MAG: EAL domain-containing protein [Thermodesulfobacteriota bacterium]